MAELPDDFLSRQRRKFDRMIQDLQQRARNLLNDPTEIQRMRVRRANLLARRQRRSLGHNQRVELGTLNTMLDEIAHIKPRTTMAT